MTEPCFTCDDRPEPNTDGYSAGLIKLPGLTKPVSICGMCLIRAGA